MQTSKRQLGLQCLEYHMRILYCCLPVQVIDDLDTVLDRFSSHKYQKAVLFVDNAGADVMLGMLPFARELVKAGTKVCWLISNSPADWLFSLDALFPARPLICTDRQQLLLNWPIQYIKHLVVSTLLHVMSTAWGAGTHIWVWLHAGMSNP